MQYFPCVKNKVFWAIFGSNDYFLFLKYSFLFLKNKLKYWYLKIIFNPLFTFQQFWSHALWLRLYYVVIVQVFLEKFVSCFTPLNPFLTKLLFKWQLLFLPSLFLSQSHSGLQTNSSPSLLSISRVKELFT